MILKPKNTTIAYRCPSCGCAVKSVVGIFSLSGDMIKLHCPCNKSNMKLTYTSDGKLRLSVPCFICGKPHEYVLTENAVFARDILCLSCPYSGMDICFTGTEKAVSKALEKAEEELYGLLEENDALDYFDGDEEDEDDAENPDISMLPMISLVVKELMADGMIKCGCSEKQNGEASSKDKDNVLLLGGIPDNECRGDIELIIRGDEYVIRCCACGKEYTVNEKNFEAFCESNCITLK